MSKQKEIFSDALTKLERLYSIDGDYATILNKLKKDFKYFSFLEQSSKVFVPSLVYKKTNIMTKHSNEMMSELLKKAN